MRLVLGAQSNRFVARDPLGRLGVAQSFWRGTTRGGDALSNPIGILVCGDTRGGSTKATSSAATGGGIESTNSIAVELTEVDRIQNTANTTAPPPAIHRSRRCVQRGRRHKAHPVHTLLSSNVMMIPPIAPGVTTGGSRRPLDLPQKPSDCHHPASSRGIFSKPIWVPGKLSEPKRADAGTIPSTCTTANPERAPSEEAIVLQAGDNLQGSSVFHRARGTVAAPRRASSSPSQPQHSRALRRSTIVEMIASPVAGG